MHPWHSTGHTKQPGKFQPWATVGHLWARKEVIITLATLTTPALAATAGFQTFLDTSDATVQP